MKTLKVEAVYLMAYQRDQVETATEKSKEEKKSKGKSKEKNKEKKVGLPALRMLRFRGFPVYCATPSHVALPVGRRP
jgi:hypothetical protein